MNRSIKIIDNKIISNIAEIDIVDHCNLSCRGCTHMAPVSKKSFIDIDGLRDTLLTLQKVYHAKVLRLVGGEPLLHPELIRIIKMIKYETEFADEIRLVTNGILYRKLTDELLNEIDILEISYYKDSSVDLAKLVELKEKTIDTGVNHLIIVPVKSFREPFFNNKVNDKKIINRIYKNCLIAHTWGCHSIKVGFFYKCAQTHILYREKGYKELKKEGIKISSDTSPDVLLNSLKNYILSEKPLNACSYCIGTVGKLFKHESVNKSVWFENRDISNDDLIDYKHLAFLENSDDDDPEDGSFDESEVIEFKNGVLC